RESTPSMSPAIGALSEGAQRVSLPAFRFRPPTLAVLWLCWCSNLGGYERSHWFLSLTPSGVFARRGLDPGQRSGPCQASRRLFRCSFQAEILPARPGRPPPCRQLPRESPPPERATPGLA